MTLEMMSAIFLIDIISGIKPVEQLAGEKLWKYLTRLGLRRVAIEADFN